MQLDVLPALADGRIFQTLGLAVIEPQIGRLPYRLALAVGRVRPGPDFRLDPVPVGVGFLLLREGLEPALAFLILVIDNPGGPFVSARGPNPFANACYGRLLLLAFGTTEYRLLPLATIMLQTGRMST